jgi:hypothetical protein
MKKSKYFMSIWPASYRLLHSTIAVDSFYHFFVYNFHIRKYVLAVKHVIMKHLLTLFFTLCTLSVYAQQGQSFPALSAVTITDEAVELPSATMGKYTLLGMAFSKKSEDALEGWFTPVFETFIGDKKSTNPLERMFSEFSYDIHLYFIPMFTGINTPAASAARKKALKELDERLHPYVLFYKGSLKPYRDALNMQAKDEPYFFLLDENGKIVYATSGNYSPQKLAQIQEAIP